MHLFWKWFYRLVVGAGVLLLAVLMLFAVGMSRAHVNQSKGWLAIGDAPRTETLSQLFPPTATKFCFARSSVGLGGRFKAYAVDGTQADLHTFAQAEFGSHWAKPAFAVTENSESPFDTERIGFLERAYSVDLEWLKESTGKVGSVYRDAKGQGSHMPTVFVDESTGTLYFVITD